MIVLRKREEEEHCPMCSLRRLAERIGNDLDRNITDEVYLSAVDALLDVEWAASQFCCGLYAEESSDEEEEG